MKHKFSQIISSLITFALLLGILPAGVLAQDFYGEGNVLIAVDMSEYEEDGGESGGLGTLRWGEGAGTGESTRLFAEITPYTAPTPAISYRAEAYEIETEYKTGDRYWLPFCPVNGAFILYYYSEDELPKGVDPSRLLLRGRTELGEVRYGVPSELHEADGTEFVTPIVDFIEIECAGSSEHSTVWQYTGHVRSDREGFRASDYSQAVTLTSDEIALIENICDRAYETQSEVFGDPHWEDRLGNRDGKAAYVVLDLKEMESKANDLGFYNSLQTEFAGFDCLFLNADKLPGSSDRAFVSEDMFSATIVHELNHYITSGCTSHAQWTDWLNESMAESSIYYVLPKNTSYEDYSVNYSYESSLLRQIPGMAGDGSPQMHYVYGGQFMHYVDRMASGTETGSIWTEFVESQSHSGYYHDWEWPEGDEAFPGPIYRLTVGGDGQTLTVSDGEHSYPAVRGAGEALFRESVDPDFAGFARKEENQFTSYYSVYGVELIGVDGLSKPMAVESDGDELHFYLLEPGPDGTLSGSSGNLLTAYQAWEAVEVYEDENEKLYYIDANEEGQAIAMDTDGAAYELILTDGSVTGLRTGGETVDVARIGLLGSDGYLYDIKTDDGGRLIAYEIYQGKEYDYETILRESDGFVVAIADLDAPVYSIGETVCQVLYEDRLHAVMVDGDKVYERLSELPALLNPDGITADNMDAYLREKTGVSLEEWLARFMAALVVNAETGAYSIGDDCVAEAFRLSERYYFRNYEDYTDGLRLGKLESYDVPELEDAYGAGVIKGGGTTYAFRNDAGGKIEIKGADDNWYFFAATLDFTPANENHKLRVAGGPLSVAGSRSDMGDRVFLKVLESGETEPVRNIGAYYKPYEDGWTEYGIGNDVTLADGQYAVAVAIDGLGRVSGWGDSRVPVDLSLALYTLELQDGRIAVSDEGDGYSASVGSNVSSLSVKAEAMTTGAAVTVAGNGASASGMSGASAAIPLNTGKNTVTITVSLDGKSETYTLTVTRASAANRGGSGGSGGFDRGGGSAPGTTAPNPVPAPAETTPPTVEELLAHYEDLDKNAWYRDGVAYVLREGIMNGTGGASFEPGAATSRAMIATILWRLEGSPVSGGTAEYDDVEDGTWYAEAVRWAESAGLVSGYGDGLFGPGDAITREQLAVMLYRYARYKGLDLGAPGDLAKFTDADSVADWAEEALQWANALGIVTGKGDGSLDPKGGATRAETATMLYRFLNR
ncbi:MAG: S-layer homology domain-containing protein [Oscillospiraceae bacterium]|nr:S-layer homology domain-containing protein [Oscillospiraceae bacterium]